MNNAYNTYDTVEAYAYTHRKSAVLNDMHTNYPSLVVVVDDAPTVGAVLDCAVGYRRSIFRLNYMTYKSRHGFRCFYYVIPVRCVGRDEPQSAGSQVRTQGH